MGINYLLSKHENLCSDLQQLCVSQAIPCAYNPIVWGKTQVDTKGLLAKQPKFQKSDTVKKGPYLKNYDGTQQKISQCKTMVAT